MVNSNFWKNKKVFLTGHTGFKGSWMSLWLIKMGANLVGFSKDIPTQPSLFEELNLSKSMQSIIGNICDVDQLKKSLIATNPDIVIHMAAQPLVRHSYDYPIETYMTNVMGSVYLLDAIRFMDSVRVVLNVTSDKCYENQELNTRFEENNPMGGHDPYSNSKGCSELVTRAYRSSYFSKPEKCIGIGTARAGNVIGGGDWAQDRLIPDIVRSVLTHSTLPIRYPKSIRPWQHVLEPLSGYLTLVEKMYAVPKIFSKSYNFGPEDNDHCDVETLINMMNSYWNNQIKIKIENNQSQLHEAKFLRLDCGLAKNELGWFPKWNIDQAIQKTVEWHIGRLDKKSVLEMSLKQLEEYENYEK